MPVVKLLGERTRGEEVFAAGDEYPCSEAEAKTLIELGFAEALKTRKPQESTPEVEAATVKAPEKAVRAKPKARG